MDELSNSLICRHIFDAHDLVNSHPPKLKNKNKKVVYEIACPSGCHHSGQLIFSRWRAMLLRDLISSVDCQTELEERSGYFKYELSSEINTEVEWYLNFAHCDLFCAYGDSLFAQDEMQVAEHPALGSLREALLDYKIEPLTVEAGKPTPILIRGVERRCAIATDSNPEQKRPFGLYGNNFARATTEAIALATQQLEPPTITNIIAIEAPDGGYGAYTKEDIEYILITAFTGFSAAKIESQLKLNRQTTTVIHTGYWGCGAYGGERVLMALLQLLAARLAKIDRLVFHTGDVLNTNHLAVAKQILNRDLLPFNSQISTTHLLAKIYDMNFQWGISDGN